MAATPKKSVQPNTPPKPPRQSIKVSPNVKVIPGKDSPASLRSGFIREKLAAGADQARKQNEKTASNKPTKADAKALKKVNNPKNSATDSRGKVNAKANARGLKAANKPSTSKAAPAARYTAAERATGTAPAKRTAAQKVALGRMGRAGGMRLGGGAGGLFNLTNLKK